MRLKLVTVLVCFAPLLVLAQSAVPVVVAKPIAQQEMPEMSIVGSLQAVNHTSITPKVDGYVSAVNFHEGQCVQQSDLLIQLDDAQAKAAVAADRITYVTASHQFDRIKKLAKSGYASKENLETVKAAFAAAKAKLAASQQALSDTELRAPFAGCLGTSDLTVGDYVSAGTPLVTLVDQKNLKVIYNVPERVLSNLKMNMPVEFKQQGVAKRFKATVSFIAPAANTDTGTVEVHALFKNTTQNNLVPGEYVTVFQPVGAKQTVLLVPQSAIVADLQGNSVYVVENGRAVQMPVTLGKRYADKVIVSKGITANSAIVTVGAEALKNHEAVSVKKG